MNLKCPVCKTIIEITVLTDPVLLFCPNCRAFLSLEEVGGYQGFLLRDTGYRESDFQYTSTSYI